jgi:hypothetical protein
MRTSKRYIPIEPSVIEEARRMDLLTYLQRFEPMNLVRVPATRNVYCTKEHDSLKISNGKWYWWSKGFGGASALDYLMKVKDVPFVEAIERLTGSIREVPLPIYPVKEPPPKQLLLPPKNKDNDKVIQYLLDRGIDKQIISDCIVNGLIYESANYYNVVFIGKSEQGKAKYAACRSIFGSDFKRDVTGSDKKYSFRLISETPCQKLHLFESAIDLLSYATLLKIQGSDYRQENLLSLSGVYQPQKELSESKVPIALAGFLKDNPQIKSIILHLDNDKAGRLISEVLKIKLKNDYEIVDEPPPMGKDFNDFLLSKLGIEQKKATYEKGVR